MSSNVLRFALLFGVSAAVAAAPGDGSGAGAAPGGGQLPALERRATPQAVVDEHLDAINRCDFTRLMAQYPPDVEFFLPDGKVVKGRAAVADLFRGFVKPVSEGGLCGLRFTPEHQQVVGDTINVMWRATAPFLLEDYLGADAYITKDGLMQAQVTTFDATRLKIKK